MVAEDNLGLYADAVADFRRARLLAKLERIQTWWTGGSDELLDYEQVRKSVRAMGQISRGVQDIRIDAIVGSVGRYTDFTRLFLPRQDGDASRWARVKLAMSDATGLPPIEVYKIDQVYFVLDGNHRISVARQMGAKYIQAYVTEVLTSVPFSADVQPDDLILKAEYADFLADTQIKQIFPDADLSVSVPGQYKKLVEHISVHRYYMGLENKREISLGEAVKHWYDEVYMPVIRIIRALGVLANFPGRTEADLYLWLMEYRAQLAERMGFQEIPLAPVAEELVKRYSPTQKHRLERVGKRVLDALTPAGLVDGPETGSWQKRTRLHDQTTLFADILVAVDGSDSGWRTLSWVLEFTRQQKADVHGLHVTRGKGGESDPDAESVRLLFDLRLQKAGVEGELVIHDGQIAPAILDWARWSDLVVISLSHPYDADPVSRLESGLRTIIRRSPSPVLAVPDVEFHLERLLLAFDDSPKAREALFVATFLAGSCQTCLDVVTVAPAVHLADEKLKFAQNYLADHQVNATFLRESGPEAAAILRAARERGADLLIMGGYGFAPVAELALGSAVDEVLQARVLPVLVCQ